MINWAKRLLKPSLLEDGFDEEGNPVEVDEPTCDVCGRVLDSEYPTYPVCGVALCGNEECANRHIAEHHPEWDENDEDDEDDEDDDRPRCDWCGDEIPEDENWCLDTRDGTEHFCSATCHNERAADIENAPLCTWCHEKCDQGVVNSLTNTLPFCSTECLERFRENGKKLLKTLDAGRCDDCERDGNCDDCPGHPKADPICAQCGEAISTLRITDPTFPGLKFCSHQCYDDYVALHG